MAIYHLHLQIISRGKGKSAVGKAAYRSSETLTNDYDCDYSRLYKKAGIVHTEILLPKNAPAEYADRSTLWNAVEKSERYKTAQIARELEIALPVELSREQQISLARRYVKETFVSAGMCADICVHDTGKGNPHAHIMLTMRPIEKDGSFGAKSRTVNGRKINTTDWSDRNKAEEWRRAWAAYANGAMRLAGVLSDDNVLDHRSFERQGIDQTPTVHMGVAASQMERNGIRTDKGDYNRRVTDLNRQLKQSKARITKLQDWLKAARDETPTLMFDTLQAMMKREANDSDYAQNRKTQMAAKALIFMQENKVSDLAEFADAVGDMQVERMEISDKLKPVQRRIDTLREHLRHSENFKNNQKFATKRTALYAEYRKLESQGLFAKGKAKKALEAAEAYDWKHLNELQDFDRAEKYLRGVLQSRFDPKKLPPITAWKRDLDGLLAEKHNIQIEYDSLNERVKSAEAIRRFAEQSMRGESDRERTKTRSHGQEL
ncbi:MAG: MobA/MobL family protein [Planctomycetota bacterium]|jgi:ATP-dependent exoDNAse (exonuclease V) alpha subunit|nr:MobA/MobL family protein [Planctomycetota bacterium]